MEPPARTALFLTGAFALLASTLATPAGAASSLSLVASAEVVDAGDPLTLTGAISDEAPCLAGRDVTITWQAATDATAQMLGATTTAADGTFSFTDTPSVNGRYAAEVDATGSCSAASSAEVAVRVRVLVEASASTASVSAGGCVHVTSSVSPPKPGEDVELQRRSAGSWSTIATSTLDDASAAQTRACFVWPDIGTARLRVRWPAQDAANATSSSSPLTLTVSEAGWMERIDELVGQRAMSVSVGDRGAPLYEHAPNVPRTPASNEKLLLSMVLLDTLGPDHRFPTDAAARSSPSHGVLRGDLWIRGRGDPQVDRAVMAALARQLEADGIERIRGRVLGSTGYFRRDWDAPGWGPTARQYVNRPTALTFDGNEVRDPEREAARALTDRLEHLGVRVTGTPAAGPPPGGLSELAAVPSGPLSAIVRSMLRPSDNFEAEVLGKALGAEVEGSPGTIAKGADAIASWLGDHGVSGFRAFDGSGLSYEDRVTARGIVHLLAVAETEPWGSVLRSALPAGGQGTLEDRLHGVPVRAKTGTLDGISALSGWVYARHTTEWLEFSILSSHLSKTTASSLEDAIVRTLHRSAR